MRIKERAEWRSSFWRPYCDPIQTPAITWSRPRQIVTVVVALCAVAYLYSVTSTSVSLLLNISLPPHLTAVWTYFARLALAAGVLLGLIYIGGLWGKYDAFSAPQRFKHGLGYYLRFCVGTAGVTFSLLYLAVMFVPALSVAARNDGVPPGFLNGLWVGTVSAVTEEIVATVFIYWVLERISLASGKTLAATSWGVWAVVLVHAMYHVSHEFRLVDMVLPLVFTALCWRYTRSLMALIVGHLTWDIIAILPIPQPVQGVGFLVAAVVGYAVLDNPVPLAVRR